MPRRSLADARILLTGASSGIGRELALAFARRGARLLLSARREDLLRVLANECAQLGASAEFVPGDLTDPGVRAALIARATALWNGLDVLVNNAGVSAHGPFATGDEPTLRQVMEVNFFAPAELTRLAIPLLKSAAPPSPERSARSENPPSPNQKSEITNHKSSAFRPAIMNVGSIIGHRGLPLNSEYAASKFALRGWTESLRAELAAEGIDVLLASPGTIDTEFVDHMVAKRAALPWANSKAIPAAVAAEQIVRALERNRREIFPNWRGRALVIADRLFPGLVDRAITRLMPRK
jgi:short-subunit dehydrogenase